MKYFAVIDTNVLVSALLASLKAKDTPPLQVLNRIFDRIITPVYNVEILSEYSEVLRRPKFSFQEDAIAEVLKAISLLGIEVSRVELADESCADPDDIVFYEVALSIDSSFLITGNLKHFPSKPFIITPSRMIEIIQAGE